MRSVKVVSRVRGWCWAGVSGTYYTITPQIPQISQSIWCKLILSPASTDRILYTEAQQQWKYEKDIRSYTIISIYFQIPKIYKICVSNFVWGQVLAWIYVFLTCSMEQWKTSLPRCRVLHCTAGPSQSFRLFYRFTAAEPRLENVEYKVSPSVTVRYSGNVWPLWPMWPSWVMVTTLLHQVNWW